MGFEPSHFAGLSPAEEPRLWLAQGATLDPTRQRLHRSRPALADGAFFVLECEFPDSFEVPDALERKTLCEPGGHFRAAHCLDAYLRMVHRIFHIGSCRWCAAIPEPFLGNFWKLFPHLNLELGCVDPLLLLCPQLITLLGSGRAGAFMFPSKKHRRAPPLASTIMLRPRP